LEKLTGKNLQEAKRQNRVVKTHRYTESI